jgi:hypothetical protein
VCECKLLIFIKCLKIEKTKNSLKKQDEDKLEENDKNNLIRNKMKRLTAAVFEDEFLMSMMWKRKPTVESPLEEVKLSNFPAVFKTLYTSYNESASANENKLNESEFKEELKKILRNQRRAKKRIIEKDTS